MKYAPDRPIVAVGSPSELLKGLPDVAKLLDFSVIVTAAAAIESFLEEVLFELFIACPQFLLSKHRARGRRGRNTARECAKALVGGRFEDVIKFLVDGPGIELRNAPEGIDADAILEIILTRNLLLHNDGIVDEPYMKRLPDSSFALGEERPITPRYIQDSLAAVEDFIVYFDNQVAEAIIRNGGSCTHEYPESHYHRRPKRGEPTPLVTCWCIVEPPDANFTELGVHTSYLSRRSDFPDRRILCYCVFEKDRYQIVENDPRYLFLPLLATPASEISEETQRRISQLEVIIARDDTTYQVLLKICAALGGRFPTLTEERDQI